MEKSRLTFEKGMMPDLDVSVRPQGAYEESVNFTATPTATNTIGTLTTAKGNILAGSLPSGNTIVGSTICGDTTVVFAVSGSTSNIYKLTTSDNYNTVGYSLVYSDTSSTVKLGFSVNYPIDAIGRYENEDSQKVYWAQENKSLRVLNLASVYTSAMSASIFDITPDYKTGTITTNYPEEGGMLKAGRVQYCFKLGVKHGQETGYSPLSKPINLFEANIGNPIDGYVGNDKDVNTGKQIKLTITVPQIGIYNIVKLYRIHYSTFGIPVVSLVLEQELTSNTVLLYDVGESLEEITLEEFNSLGSRYFYAKTITAKDNMLFAGNITEPDQELDIDCRAYRFTNSRICKLYQVDGTYYQIESDTSWRYLSSSGNQLYRFEDGKSTEIRGNSWITLPKDIDAINHWNDEFTNPVDTYSTDETHQTYKQIDGTTRGGSGPIVSYSCANKGIVNPYGAALYDKWDTYYGRTEDEKINQFSDRFFTHKPGEIYRYGIVWLDLKGKPFPVKWIGDIRIPSSSLSPFKITGSTSGGEGLCYVDPITIKFTVNTSAIPAEEKAKVSGYIIVRCKKEQKDRQVIASGVTWTAGNYDNGVFCHQSFPRYFSQTEITESEKDYVHPFYSPELYFNGGIPVNGKEYRAKITSIFGSITYAKDSQGVLHENNSSASTLHTIISMRSVITPDGDNSTKRIIKNMSFKINDISNVTITEKDGTVINLASEGSSVSGFNVKNRAKNNYGRHDMYGPTSAFFTTGKRLWKNYPTNIGTKVNAHDTNIVSLRGLLSYGVDIYVNNARGVFGGITHQARMQNNYVIATDFIPISTVSPTIEVYGDVRTTVFEMMTCIHDPNVEDADGSIWGTGSDVDRQQVCTLIPVASYVDCSMSKLKPSKYVFEQFYIPPGTKTSRNTIGLQETTAKGISLYGEKYPVTLPDLTSYNTAYSEVGSYPTYSAEKGLSVSQEHLPFTVIASEKKTNGELTDSWTSFKYTNLIDVDTVGGKINALKTVDNKLFFWQDKAFGIISNNDRYVLNEGSVGQLALGSGGILERYDYLSTNIGSESKSQITANENQLFWMYDKLKKIYSYDTDLKDLGLLYACNSYIDKKYPTIPLAYYDYIEDEVLFKLNDRVLVYDPIIKAFVSTLSYVPDKFIQLPTFNFLSVTGSRNMYLHNSDTNINAKYYGTYTVPSLTVSENKTFDTVKVFDTLNWSSNYTKLGSVDRITQQSTTFDKLEINNDYQYSGLVTMLPKRREREFTYALPRDILNKQESTNPDIYLVANQDASQLFKRRFRDRYLKLKLYLTSTMQQGDRMTVHYLDVNYRNSVR